MNKILKALYFPFLDLVTNAQLITTLVKRDFMSRYRASSVGLFWTLIQPAFMIGVYTVTFSLIMNVRFGTDASPTSFVLYLFCGMLPWLAFSEALSRSSTVVLENSNFVKKLVFPTQILPINMMLSALITEGIGILILIVAILLFKRTFHLTVALLPIVLIPQVLLTLGLGWILASLTVFIRDIANFLNLILTAWLFLTPIFYPEQIILQARVPHFVKTLFVLNPMYTIVTNYRRIFLEGKMVEIRPLAILTLGALLIFWMGYAWFYRTRRSFADVL
ncbi:MAG: ABC transporter permease [Terriglobia bacterium]|jgi:lipopolysaccharide transport system permease protein